MVLLRSLIFSGYFYTLLAVLAVAVLPAVALWGEKPAMWAARQWSRAGLFGVRIICGIRYEVRGAEHIPTGKYIVAAKHQAMWEALFFSVFFSHPIMVFKKELKSFPLYGWYIARAGMIEVDREAGASALKTMLRAAQAKLAPDRPLVIFPEGTRQAPGAAPDYKPGIAGLYALLGAPCVPVALNSGLYWQGKGLLRWPGKIIVEFLEPIAPGLARAEFMATVQDRIETASNRLMAEGRGEAAAIPSPARRKTA